MVLVVWGCFAGVFCFVRLLVTLLCVYVGFLRVLVLGFGVVLQWSVFGVFPMLVFGCGFRVSECSCRWCFCL